MNTEQLSEQLKEEVRLRLMKIIAEAEQKLAQRELAKRAGISLGKTNYWITEMVNEGLLKVERLKNAGNKLGYRYILTPKGMEEKFRLLIHFLSRKIREYENLGKEIEELNRQVRQNSGKIRN
jgi:EPS-associated MarR family transcriptional regulator